MEPFSIGLPTSLVIINFLIWVVLIVIPISFGYGIYKYMIGNLIIKVNNNLIEVNLFNKSLSDENRPNSYVSKDINGQEVFVVMKKHFSYTLCTPTTSRISATDVNEVTLKLNEPVKITSELSNQITVTRLQ
jgi:hypothetical protein